MTHIEVDAICLCFQAVGVRPHFAVDFVLLHAVKHGRLQAGFAELGDHGAQAVLALESSWFLQYTHAYVNKLMVASIFGNNP